MPLLLCLATHPPSSPPARAVFYFFKRAIRSKIAGNAQNSAGFGLLGKADAVSTLSTCTSRTGLGRMAAEMGMKG